MRVHAGRTARLAAIVGFALAACLGLLGSSQQALAGIDSAGAAQTAGKIERAVLKDTENGKSASFIVLMAEQANLTAAYGMRDQDARGWYVYNTLKNQAERTQTSIKALLDARGIAYKSYWAANLLVVTGDRSLVEELAARTDVGKVESNRPFKAINDPTPESSGLMAPQTVPEWNVQNVRAPEVWAMGFTGQGIVIGNQDTGMRWTHQALQSKYRGWNGSTADHNFNWWDSIHSGGGSCGANSQVPCDDQGHGTHTTGTTSGDDGAGNQVGVAPGARWIGCRNMNVGTGAPATYTECFQFFLAPTDLTGQNPNPALRPHVTNNSWYCDATEGCTSLDTFRALVEAHQASGIMTVASTGNEGPGCSTVQFQPAIYEASFSVGSITSSNTMSGFSSRGPVTVDGSNRLKPNISAPGSSVRSSTRTNDTSYGSLSGTSMAGPHVVGVVALLWSARPELSRMITETKILLQNTANPNVVVSPVQTCGGIPSSQIPNHTFGYGRVDALAAVQAGGGTPTPTFTGTPPTNTPGPATNTPTATATGCAAGGWTDVAAIPALRGRALGVNQGNNIWLFGGRPDSTTYTTSIYRYDLAGNSWTLSTSVLPDAFSSNMLGGLLTFPEGERVFIVGGSGTGSVVISRTLAFNPSDGTFTPKASWPASPERIPGGAAVMGNKLYVFGGFRPVATSGVVYADIWVYDPTTNTWTESPTDMSMARGYIATEAMPDGLIYIAGGSQITTTTVLSDETIFEKFNPATNAITTGPAMPAPRSNNQGYNVGGKFFVPAGGFLIANHTTAVHVYDPVANSWSTGTAALHATRNYAKGYGLSGSIHVIGGNDDTGAVVHAYNQKYAAGGGCPTPGTNTPTATNTPPTPPPPTGSATFTRTSTPTATGTGTTAPTNTQVPPTSTNTQGPATQTNTPEVSPTPCNMTFTDVLPSDYFYVPVEYMYCHGIISGYADNTFRPFNTTTRGQLTKIVVLGFGFELSQNNVPTFADVPTTDTFYVFIETAAENQLISGYACGGPGEPCDEQNRPYFRTYNLITRGQLAKVTVIAANWELQDPATQTFTDVLPQSTFYTYVETAYCHQIISGYSCGGPGEPCDEQNRPYFRQFGPATRGQIAKIVYLAILDEAGCATGQD